MHIYGNLYNLWNKPELQVKGGYKMRAFPHVFLEVISIINNLQNQKKITTLHIKNLIRTKALSKLAPFFFLPKVFNLFLLWSSRDIIVSEFKLLLNFPVQLWSNTFMAWHILLFFHSKKIKVKPTKFQHYNHMKYSIFFKKLT